MAKNNIKKIIKAACISTLISVCILANLSNFNTISYNKRSYTIRNNMDVNIREDIYDTGSIIPKRDFESENGSGNTTGNVKNGNENGNTNSNSNTDQNGNIVNEKDSGSNSFFKNNKNKESNTNDKKTNSKESGKKGNFIVSTDTSNTKLRKIQKNNDKKFADYKNEYNNSTILGTIAYILRFLSKISIIIFVATLIISFVYSNIIKNGNNKASVNASTMRLKMFKFMIVCQILPFIFALLVKGWRK